MDRLRTRLTVLPLWGKSARALGYCSLALSPLPLYKWASEFRQTLLGAMAVPLGAASVAWACGPPGYGTPDTTPPAPPTITSPPNNSYDTDGSFSVAGTAEPGSAAWTGPPATTVRLYEGATLRGTATVTGNGEWSVALAGVPEGRHT